MQTTTTLSAAERILERHRVRDLLLVNITNKTIEGEMRRDNEIQSKNKWAARLRKNHPSLSLGANIARGRLIEFRELLTGVFT